MSWWASTLEGLTFHQIIHRSLLLGYMLMNDDACLAVCNILEHIECSYLAQFGKLPSWLFLDTMNSLICQEWLIKYNIDSYMSYIHLFRNRMNIFLVAFVCSMYKCFLLFQINGNLLTKTLNKFLGICWQ